jgi:WD40 repeat protein
MTPRTAAFVLFGTLFLPVPRTSAEPQVDSHIGTQGDFGGKCFAFSPDGKIVAGAFNAEIRLNALSDGKQQSVLKGHTEHLTFLSFTADGKTLFSAGADGKINLWDIETRKVRQSFDVGADSVAPLAISRDGKFLASFKKSKKDKVGELRCWDVGKGEARLLTGHRGPVLGMAFSPDGKTLASGSEDHTAMLWDVSTGRKLQTLREHTGPVYCVAFHPDGTTLVTLAEDNLAKFWDVKTGQDHTSFDFDQGRFPKAIAFSPDGKTLVLGGNGFAWLYDASTLKRWASMRYAAGGGITSISFSPDGKWIGGIDGSIAEGLSKVSFWKVGELFEKKAKP